jgi:hypothetical protein
MHRKLLGTIMWISTQHVNYGSYILHWSNTLGIWEYNEAVHQLFIDIKKAYDSVRSEVLYNILRVRYPYETGKANKMCMKETYSSVNICVTYLILRIV